MHSNLFSHPDRFLEDHTSCVIDLAKRFFENIENVPTTFKDFLTIITFSHDIGKSTKFFQKYIKGNKTLKNRQETKHALLSAVVSLHLANKHLPNDLFLLSLSFVLPKRHHSNLKNFLSEFFLDESAIEILKNQIASIDRQKFQIFLQNIKNCDKKLINFTFDEIDFDTIKAILTKIRRFIRKLKNEKSLNYYIDTVLFFSLLLDADKSDAGIQTDKTILFQKISLQPDIVDNFIQTFKPNDSTITQLRQRAYQEVSQKKIDINQKIYTLTLPTGLGKTLISFKTALRIANEVKRQKEEDLKIIYCLPFLAIIEQNFQVFEEVLKNNGITPDSAILLKHHHLSGFAYKNQEEEFDYDTSRILIEGWNAKIVVTTFLQFFYSLIGNKNRMLRKFHKLTNAVVILDEVQSIPHQYWLLLQKVLTQMTERFNFYIIFTTATQPMIFKKHLELASPSYFEKLNRYNVIVDKKTQTLQEFFDNLQINNQSHLFILNTVNSAKKLYEMVKNSYKVVYLSTHIVPKERIKRIQELKGHKKQIAISTQLIEAGVDIDFDRVYRDFAPFDSLNQSAGRCNREGKKEKGDFHIIKLIDENGRLYGSYIYDAILLNATDEILTNSTYTEQEFIQLIKSYFHKISQIKSDKISLDLLEMLYSLKFSAPKEPNQIHSIEDFILIKEDSYKQDVFIEIDDEAKEVWQSYANIWQIEDLFEKKKAFEAIKANFYQFVVSVPIQENTPPIVNNFYYVSFDSLADYYDLETGFIPKREYYVY
ncbi:CRISPR-associated endonuclease/helicase Cas3 [Nitratiruptor sp. YY08-26]|uniref:CRISPR-associated helicase Cas3' n=1 Tax=unclassified Nitratiruptor TaxID=2624044 RepID=UPI0019161763|nr:MULTISPECIES: CRISPR-associated helicase Cas3' [unclassified Nitratiruptor]BCD61375.1 CRISPR-associated endonuclease/helicase Cas3 [Nitratiruptor sp. YY08-13]BCD65309.1 CRISPR-associated endonuclease/helicase Cas3 [Nitratiruptor sp. YY08-26]